jgi:hypothetical protein
MKMKRTILATRFLPAIILLLNILLLNIGPTWADVTDLIWSTFVGGSNADIGYGVTYDEGGNVYLVGQAGSDDFPTTSGAYDTVWNGGDAFVAKLNANGTTLVYATYLGGTSPQTEEGFDIVLDGNNRACVTGVTWSADFPTTYGSYDTTHNGFQDAFVVRLNASGTDLDFSTFLGSTGFDLGYGITMDNSGNILVTGSAGDGGFPTTNEAVDTTYANVEGFVAKLNPTGSTLLYSTFLGGSEEDYGRDIVTDSPGNAYVTGYSNSLDFPTTSSAYDTSHNGDYDVFIVKLNTTGSTLMYSTYLGGNNSDYGYDIALDDTLQVHVAGETYSSDFPVTPGAFDTIYANGEAFVAKLNSSASALRYSTYLGGDQSDLALGISLDTAQRAFVTGETYSSDYPTTVGAYDLSANGQDDAFVTTLKVGGDSLHYSTFLGGSDSDWGTDIAIDDFDNIYLTGLTASANFPVTSGVFDTLVGSNDGFAAKMNLAGGDAVPPDAIDDLAISLENFSKGGDVRLTWSEPYDNIAVARYVIYRSASAATLGDSVSGTTDTTYLDAGAVGDPDTNWAYTVKSVDTSENRSMASNAVGEYDFSLKATTGTDYTWVALCLGDSGLIMASDLENHIEANSSPATNCYTVSEWNATAQTYTTYTTIPIPIGDFPLQTGRAYRVEVSGNAVWSLVGDVPPTDSVSFALTTTTGTDYTWLSIPMQLAAMDSASDLEDHIEANSSPATNCYTVSEWNATAQTYTTYTTIPIPIGNFAVAAGRAYRVEVSGDATWPVSKGLGKDAGRRAQR